jgi:hypothetical protein
MALSPSLLSDPTNPLTATVQGITAPVRPRTIEEIRAARAERIAAREARRNGTGTGTTPTPTGIAPNPNAIPAPSPTPPPVTLPSTINVPTVNYTPTQVTTAPITAAEVPTAPTAAQAATGIAPLSSVDTTQDLPELRDDSVEAAITRLLSQDSDLMKQARTAGLKLANQRGVLNSSIGIGAAQNEQIKAALPIAAQEAAQNAASNQQRYDLAAQMARLRSQAGFDQLARAEGYQYQSSLNTQGYAFQAQQLKNQQQFEKDMAKIQQGYAVDMAGLQYTLQSKLQSQANSEQIQRMGIDFQNNWRLQQQQATNVLNQIKAQGDIQLKLQANQMEEAMKELTLSLNSQNSIAMANASVNLFNAEAQLRAALLSNPNIPASERAAYEQQISALTKPTRDYISGVLGYTPTSTTPTSTTTPTTPTTPTGTTGGTTGIAPMPQRGDFPPTTAGGQAYRAARADYLDNR